MEAELFFEKCCGLCRFYLRDQILFTQQYSGGTCTEPTLQYKRTDYFGGNDCWKFSEKPESLNPP